MSLGTALTVFKAAADPTRLRLLAALAGGEATVGELQQILEQSQPRVSRHLRLLGEAGLVERFRDGQSVYYRLAANETAVALHREILRLAGPGDDLIRHDAGSLRSIQRNRRRSALAGAAGRLARGAAITIRRPDGALIADAIEEAIGDAEIADALDIGCGGGMLLRALGERAHHVTGIDKARRMRVLARARVHEAGLANCTVRDADMHALPFGDESFDVVLLDEVLAHSADLATVIREAKRVLRPSGRLLVLDHILPAARRLSDRAGGPLFENQVHAAMAAAGLRASAPAWFPGPAPEYALITAAQNRIMTRTGTDD